MDRERAASVVLVVDDDPPIRELLDAVLKEEGCSVISATDGAQALELIRAGAAPDLLLLDIGLPVVNGIEFVRAYRSHIEPPYAPIVIVSARGDAASVARDLDCDAYLNKPFDIEDLLSVVRSALALSDSPARHHTYGVDPPSRMRGATPAASATSAPSKAMPAAAQSPSLR